MSCKLYNTKHLNRQVIIKWLKQSDSLVSDSIDFLQKHYNSNEPISRSININGNENDKIVMKQTFERCIKSDASIVALDAQTREMVGVYLHEIETRNKGSSDNSKLFSFVAKPSVLHEAFNNLQDRMKKETDLFGRFTNAQTILEHSYASVHPNWLNEGISKMAMDFVRRFMIRELNCDLAFSICTSYYTAKFLESCGYKEMMRIRYDDLKHNERPMFMVEPPHDSITFKMFEYTKL